NFFFQAEDGIRDRNVTGVQTCALPISLHRDGQRAVLQHTQVIPLGVGTAHSLIRLTLCCRTQEGLGYSVGCVENDTFGILGFNVYVSTSADKFNCTHIEGRIGKFVDKTCYEYVMQKLSQEKFDEFVSSAIKRKEAPDVSLEKEVRRHMDEINSFDYCFDRLKREI